jgi:signal transduction histidine kinase
MEERNAESNPTGAGIRTCMGTLTTRRIRRAGQVFIITTISTMVGASLVLLARLFDNSLLGRPFPGWPSMATSTALGLLLTGASLLLLGPHARPSVKRVFAGRSLATLVIILGIVTLIDGFLFANGDPNRLAPLTALSFVTIGIALLFCCRFDRFGGKISQALAIMVAVTSYMILVGYLYGITYLSGLPHAVAMPVRTAACFVLLSIATACMQPREGLVGILVSEHLGGHLARRLIPAVFLIPALVGMLRLAGETAGFYDTVFGIAAHVATTVLLFAGVTWWSAAVVDQLDAQRLDALITIEAVSKARELERERLQADLEERVLRRTAELAAANAELEAFSYSVSHDLRAPLRWVDGFTQALVEDCADKLDETGHEHIRQIRESVHRMSDLIDALLKLSRITRAPIEHSDVDVSQMARRIAADLETSDGHRRVKWDITSNIHASGDALLIRVVMENLLRNAWKFTRKQEAACIQVGVMDQDNERVYFVRDNGVGFDMTYVNKLFRSFERLHRTEDFEGTGIGLALVNRVVQRHGGRTWAEGHLNEGATFYFTMGAPRESP